MPLTVLIVALKGILEATQGLLQPRRVKRTTRRVRAMNKGSNLGIIVNGLIRENPTFVLVLGMCPTLGTTTSAINALGMGLATMFVLIGANMVIAAIKGVIPDKVRIPSFIVVIATFVTIVQMTMEAYVPALYKSLGVYIPLIVVNCIILGRAEAFAAKNNVIRSMFDGIGIGLGFTVSLPLLFVLAPGAFLVLAYLMLLFNRFVKK